MIKRLLLTWLCLLTTCWPGVAASEEGIDFYGGSDIGTYQDISEDLKGLLAEKHLALNIHETDGSIENIKRIAASDKPSIGLVQADVLSFMRRSKNPDTQRFAERIRMIMPLYEEEVHILSHTDIKQFSDLHGKRVVVGQEGSGNMLTAVNLLAISNIRVGETMRLSAPQGALAVLEGRADAVIYVGGKPVKLFKNIENLQTADGKKFSNLLGNVHLIPVSSPAILAEYATTSITPEDYQFVKETVPTIAVQAVLITGNYEEEGKEAACTLINKAAYAIRHNMDQLKKTGHPKWRDTNISLPISLWEKDSCSWPNKKSRINPKKAN